MRVRLLPCLLFVCLCVSAQTKLSVDQLVTFIRSSIQLKHPDKQVAAYVTKLKLTEQLDDRTIEDLQGQGAGTKTVEALKELRDASKDLPKPLPKQPKPTAAPIPPPTAAEQQQ